MEVDGAKINLGEASWEDDAEGNQFDTEETVQQALEHNAKWDELCSKGGAE